MQVYSFGLIKLTSHDHAVYAPFLIGWAGFVNQCVRRIIINVLEES